MHGVVAHSALRAGACGRFRKFAAPASPLLGMLQLNPPLARVIVGGHGWTGPTGKGIANLIEPGHHDDDVIWIIDLNETGQTWCVPNRFVRAPANITYGRKSEGVKGRSLNLVGHAG